MASKLTIQKEWKQKMVSGLMDTNGTLYADVNCCEWGKF